MFDLVRKGFGEVPDSTYKVFRSLTEDFAKDFENLFGDIVYTEDNVTYLEIEVPGFNKDNVNVDLSECILTIKGERDVEEKHAGKKELFKRFSVNDGIKDITAEVKDGILYITLKKPETEKIKIQVK